MTSNHLTLVAPLILAASFVGLDSLAQVPAQKAQKPAPVQTARTASQPAATPAPKGTASKPNPRQLPSNSPAIDRTLALIQYQKKKRDEIKNYSCPPNVRLDTRPTTSSVSPSCTDSTRSARSNAMASTTSMRRRSVSCAWPPVAARTRVTVRSRFAMTFSR